MNDSVPPFPPRDDRLPPWPPPSAWGDAHIPFEHAITADELPHAARVLWSRKAITSSSPPPAEIVICYDICDDRRRYRVAKLLEQVGRRVQESVFVSTLDEARLQWLFGQLLGLIDPCTDDVRCFPRCRRCQQRTLTQHREGTTASDEGTTRRIF